MATVKGCCAVGSGALDFSATARNALKDASQDVVANPNQQHHQLQQHHQHVLNVHPEVKAAEATMIARRRHLHKHPELSFQEHETAKFFADALRQFQFDIVEEGVGRTGVVGVLYGTKTDNETPSARKICVAIRADMDALPVHETETDLNATYKSQVAGKMHACGHDGHMSIALCVAEICSKSRHKFSGSIKIIGQPAEEGFGGAREMIKDGVLGENPKLGPKVDAIYGLHLWSFQPTGTVDIRLGPQMAASDRINITVHGSGGHGAVPNEANDAIVAASHLITQLHSIVSRNVSPLESAVLSIGVLNAGFGYNVIADKASIEGTVRTYLPSTRQLMKTRVTDICKGVEQSFGVRIDLEYRSGYPAVINTSRDGVAKVVNAVKHVLGEHGRMETAGTMCSEDYGYLMDGVIERGGQGAWFFCGCAINDGQLRPHHKSSFDIDEQAMLVGASVFMHVIESSLF